MTRFYSGRLFISLLAILIAFASNSATSQINLTLTTVTGSFVTEVGWQVVNTGTNVVYNCEPFGGTMQNNVTLNVPAGTYQLRGWDSWGDGWNGCSVTIKYQLSGILLVNAATLPAIGTAVTCAKTMTCPGPTATCDTRQVLATFTVVPPCLVPTISANPLSQKICVGSPVTFSVTTNMTNGTYEWRKNGVTLVKNTSNTYTIPSVTLADAGSYDVIVADNCNPAIAFKQSTAAVLTVAEAPKIVTQPISSKVICENANDTLRVRATGTDLTYQWRLNGSNISGATSADYIINNMDNTKDGTYDCVVSGYCSPAETSTTSQLTAAMRPRFTSQPNNQDICPGTPATLAVVATGQNLEYQWYKDGVIIPDAINASYTIAKYSYNNNGQYYCAVKSNIPNPNNCQLTVQSRQVKLTGFPAPTITTHPTSTDVCVGSRLSLQVVAQGSGISYQWFKNGVAIPNSDVSELLLTNVTPATTGDYTVRVTAVCGLNVTSNVAKVTAIAKPVFIAQPTAKTLTVGDRLELTVNATDVRSIQWKKNDQPIQGATGATFVIEKVGKGDAGYYNAVVSNPCGGASSAYSNVVVNDQVVPTPALELSTQSIDFGEIPVGYDKTLLVSGLIKNVGTAPLLVSGMTIMPSDFTISNAPTLPLTLAPGQTADVTLKAAPTTKGPLTGSLSIASNSPSNPTATVALTAAYVLRYDHAATEDFGTVLTDASLERCIVITNTSAVNITIEQATFTGANAGQFSVVTALPLAIAAGQSADLCVKFTPGSPGSKTATLNLRSSNGGNSSMSVSGSGETPGGVVDATEAGVTAWPNPMTDRVEVRFAKPTPAMEISVVSSTGRTVAAFSNDGVEAGGSVRWNGRDASGASVSSGSYTMVIRYSDTVIALPITIVK